MATATKKTVVKKTVVKKKPEKKEIASSKTPRNDNASAFSLPVFDAKGKEKGEIEVPKALFGTAVNQPLLSQAVRVYLSNQRAGGANTKTRGEVEGSTRKIYRQKGTGRARHGGVRAPIFVGGGIAFGPRTHSFSMSLPQKMKRKALESGLSLQYANKNIFVIDGIGSLEPKTKLFAKILDGITGGVPTLLVIDPKTDVFAKAVRNIPYVDVARVSDLNTYSILSHQKILFTKSAINTIGI